MPVTNGAIPIAPEGGQSSQSGTLFERAAVPAADARLDAGEAAGADAPGPAPAALPEPPTGAVIAAELLGAVRAVDGGVVPGNATAPYGFARVAPATPLVVAVV